MNSPTSPIKRELQKIDVVSSATISGFFTFFLLTFSKQVSEESVLFPYLTDHSISFISAICTAMLAFLLSLVRFEVRLLIHKLDYNRKISFLNKMIENTTDPKVLSELNETKKDLVLNSARRVIEEKI
ncbi:hypothetical protein [Marinomonas gallaica]|uniref:hypothetical protein n=1 Tax=Marinomonas gallaica TaxID=1806667 RepID=UPI003A9460E8